MAEMMEKTICVNDYSNEVLAMTIGCKGKNFINWTENTKGINFIWHNKETNKIEIRGEKDGEFNNVMQTIRNVLAFNKQIILDRNK